MVSLKNKFLKSLLEFVEQSEIITVVIVVQFVTN
jgi:hypothetical protein